MNNLTATVKGSLTINATKTRDVGSVPYSITLNPSNKFTFGTGALQVNKLFDDIISVAATSSQTLDLATLGVDAFGDATAMVEMKALLVINGNSAGSLSLKPGATNPLESMFGTNTGSEIIVPPSGFVIMSTGDATGFVSDGTHKNIKIQNNDASNAASVTVVILGNGA